MQRESGQIWAVSPAGAADQSQARQAASTKPEHNRLDYATSEQQRAAL